MKRKFCLYLEKICDLFDEQFLMCKKNPEDFCTLMSKVSNNRSSFVL